MLPQSPTAEWLDLLASDVTDEDGPNELHELLVHTLGNLTLTAENAKLSNNPFQRKQDIYEASALQMNREIADAPAWGKANILARADRLTERAIRLWPGPIGAGADDGGQRDWTLLQRACAALPEGLWTTYGDLAELIGSHPVPVGVHLATHDVPNAWRVLMADGTISPGFRWEDPNRHDDPVELLRQQGVVFNDGRADPAKRWIASEIAALLGMETAETPQPEDLEQALDSERGQAFLQQLRDAHPAAVDGVLEMLRTWRELGGYLSFGRSSETSCFMELSADRFGTVATWPMTIYPKAGSVEVVFQHMRRRPVFSDLGLRDEFRQRLLRAGVVIPESKLNLRPSFRVELLENSDALVAVKVALEWFAMTFQTSLAQDEQREVGDAGDVLGVK